MNEFPHLRAAVFGTPWAIMEDRFEAIIEVLERRINGVRLAPEEIDAIRGDRQVNGVLEMRSLTEPEFVVSAGPCGGTGTAITGNLIAVINVMGIVAQHASQVDGISGAGGTSTERVGASFRQAIADPNVKAIVLNVDSPGGSVSGVQALADEIFKARGKKPIIAQVNSLAASAAYWIAAAADEIVMTPGAQVGSIGVYATHKDVSAAAEKEGVKVTFISAGKFKVEGNPFEALNSEAASAMQSMVDSYYVDFVSAVARGRGVSAEDVRGGFGQGRVVKDKAAVKEGMADRIDTLDGTLKRISSNRPSSRAARALSPIATPDSLGKQSFEARVSEDGSRKCYAMNPWPASMLVSELLIDDVNDVFSLDEEAKSVTITTENAMAVYDLVGLCRGYQGGYDFVCSLRGEPIYEPAPENASSSTEATSDEKDAWRRRRHAARHRRMNAK